MIKTGTNNDFEQNSKLSFTAHELTYRKEHINVKKWIKYLLEFIGMYFILYLFAPLSGVSDLSEYMQEFYWLKILICELVVFFLYIYFQEINPRKHTMIFVEKSEKQTVLKSLTFSACILAWFALEMVIVILVSDNTFAKLVLIVLWLFVFPILYYAFFYRGISIYKNKKIRVFNFKVTTYINGIIEDIKIEELGKTSKLIVSINGKENVFWVSSKSAQKYMSKLQKATIDE